MKPEYMEALQEAIRENFGCASSHVSTEHISEKHGNIPVWEGDVELFDIREHPKATQCYAWAYKHDGKWKCVTVLKIGPVSSPKKAIQAYILSHHG